MNDMQQRIYQPPNVAGWEGGMSWFNTNTVQGRFGMIVRAQYLRYSNYYEPARRRPSTTRRTSTRRRPQAVFERAYAAVNRPWISEATRTALIAWAGSIAGHRP